MVGKGRRINYLVIMILHKAKFIILSVGIVALLVYLVVKLTWLAIIIFILLSIIVFVYNLVEHGTKKGLAELLKDLFWRW
jgi:hypothetical protein